MTYLRQIRFELPNTSPEFSHNFLSYMSSLGKVSPDEIVFSNSKEDFIPITSILFSERKIPQACFVFSDDSSFCIDIINTTNISQKSPHHYLPISITEFIRRVTPFKLKYMDHIGFNLPYFEGIHPKILDLRERLKSACLYHTFPKHLEDAPWDFILPGTKEEIDRSKVVDYRVSRKPKIEIVSFDKSSKPLIQLDIQLEGKYEEWMKIFPEAIHIEELRNLWVYIENNFGIDICFVLNEAHNNDWSHEFSKSRIV